MSRIPAFTALLVVLCGSSVALAANAGKVEICHATSSVTNPYVIIEVSQNAWSRGTGHGAHAEDFETLSDGTCDDSSTCDPIEGAWVLDGAGCTQIVGDSCDFSVDVGGTDLVGGSTDGVNYTVEDGGGIVCTGIRDSAGNFTFTCDAMGIEIDGFSLSDQGTCTP